MKLLKKILIILLVLGLLLFALATWYKQTFSMDPVSGYSVNSTEMPKKMLIATQGSHFKNLVTKGIVDEYRKDSIFINVVDALNLAQENASEYDVLVLMHTWENWKAPQPVTDFVMQLDEDGLKKTVVLTTSGQGDYKMEQVDAITGESDIENVEEFTGEMVSKIDIILKVAERNTP